MDEQHLLLPTHGQSNIDLISTALSGNNRTEFRWVDMPDDNMFGANIQLPSFFHPALPPDHITIYVESLLNSTGAILGMAVEVGQWWGWRGVAGGGG